MNSVFGVICTFYYHVINLSVSGAACAGEDMESSWIYGKQFDTWKCRRLNCLLKIIKNEYFRDRMSRIHV